MPDIDNQIIYWILMASFLMPLVLFGLLIWFLHIFQTKKYQNEVLIKDAMLREQSVIIEKHELVERERQRIASEMHDDLGSGLTRIKYMCDKLNGNDTQEDKRETAKKISSVSSELVGNMSEIIWALNSRFDNTRDLIGYIRRYVSEYLEERSIDFEFANEGYLHDHQISGEKRRNIFLTVKEIVNNSVKYSGADQIRIIFHIDGLLSISICEENGSGFDPEIQQDQGNGIFNIIKRMESVGGKIIFQRTDQSMNTILSLPFKD
jgi:signal transduction histidine kinase